MSKSGGLISEKTYRKYLKIISILITLDPDKHTRNGRKLLKIAKMVEAYEKQRFGNNHSKRQLRGDL